MSDNNISIIKTKLGNFSLQTKNKRIIILKPSNHIETKFLTNFHKKIYLQLKQYLDNKISSINIACNPQGSLFQKKVWIEIKKINYGHKKSYFDIAKNLKTSARAVGNACSKNPCLFIIPCHRVIRKDGSTGGYLMGKKIKQYLLKNELNEFKL